MDVRPSAIAGSFYPADPRQVRADATALLAAAPAAAPAKVFIAPHAGWMYSAAVAAPTYRALAQDTHVRRVAILCPAHRVYVEGMAIPAWDAFATPLGEVPVDTELLGRLAGLPGVSVSDAAHRDEHAIEVHLPLLQVALQALPVPFQLVPVVVGSCAPETVAGLLDQLLAEPDLRVIISSDLSHFESDASARVHDAETARRIEAMDVSLAGDDACGAHALNGLMCWLREYHNHSAAIERLALANSGDASGDRSRVVGYGAWRVDAA